MKMSVYRQRTPVFQLEHGVCITGVTTSQDVDLIDLALSGDKPVLIGLDGQTTIIKTVGAGDEGHSFESLYDTCITLADLKKAKERGVPPGSEMPLDDYEVKLLVTIRDAELEVPAILAGRNHGELRKLLRDLLNENSAFRAVLIDRIAYALIHQEADVSVAVRDAHLFGVHKEGDDVLWDFPD
jgi:hypothetical protein